MAAFTKKKFSSSTNGKPINITATASTGTSIHTADSDSGDWDEIWMYASNISGSDVLLTVEFGGTGTSNEIDITVPANSIVTVIPGCILGGAASLNVTAYAGTTAVINVFGFVNALE